MKHYSYLYFPLVIVLILLIVSTLFVGVSLNGGEKGRVYVWSYEVLLINAINEKVTANLFEIFLCSILFLLHAGICLLPFFINKKYFYTTLICIPLAFIIIQMAAFVFIGLLLIPFFILWIISLIVFKQIEKAKMSMV
jgi:hypothetical protein